MANSGTFKPGHSKLGGRKKELDVADVRALAAKWTQEAIDRLVFWLKSDNPKASTLAAQALLDRGHGKPAQTILATVEHKDLRGPDTDALTAKLAESLSGRARTEDPAPTVQ